VEKLMGLVLHLDGVKHEVDILARRPHLKLKVDGREYVVNSPGEAGDGRGRIEVEGKSQTFVRAQVGERQLVRICGRTFEAEPVDPRDEAGAGGGQLDGVRAPMPCSVVEVHKRPGDRVVRGETLVTVESMKLQIALVAPRDGMLARTPQVSGETFEKDAIVAALEPLEGN
jgi:biotin carboxyl carrier protein